MRATLPALTLTIALGVPAAAYMADLSADPKVYRKYFDLQKGDNLVKKVSYLGDRVRADNDSDKRDKSTKGVRQALNDLFTSIEDIQRGRPDPSQSRMLKVSLPAEKALALAYEELRQATQALDMGRKEVKEAKAVVDAISAAHQKAVGAQQKTLGAAGRFVESIVPGNAYTRPQAGAFDAGAAGGLSDIQPQQDKIYEAAEKLDQSVRVMEIVGKRVAAAGRKLDRVLPEAEKAGRVHASSRESLGADGGANSSRAILKDATQTARKAMALARKVYDVLKKLQAKTQSRLVKTSLTEEAVAKATPAVKKAFLGAATAEGKVLKSQGAWDQAADDAGRSAAAAKAGAAKGEGGAKLAPAAGPVTQAAAAAKASAPAKSAACGQKASTAALGKGAKKLKMLSDFVARVEPGDDAGGESSGGGRPRINRGGMRKVFNTANIGVRFDGTRY